MLSVKFICVGKMKERFYLDAFAEYRKRLGAYCNLELTEIGEQRLPEKPSRAEIDAALEREAGEILKAIPADAYVTANFDHLLAMARGELSFDKLVLSGQIRVDGNLSKGTEIRNLLCRRE